MTNYDRRHRRLFRLRRLMAALAVAYAARQLAGKSAYDALRDALPKETI